MARVESPAVAVRVSARHLHQFGRPGRLPRQRRQCCSQRRGDRMSMKQRELIALGTAGIALLLLGVLPACAEPVGRYQDYHRGAYLAYLNAPGPQDDIRAIPRLRIAFGGRSYAAIMDTGSVGVVVSANKIPNIHSLQSLGPGQLTYSSSGRIMIGQWVVTPMTIMGGNGARVTTAPIPVLAVTRVECMPLARRCVPNPAPQRISMLGIGFGRRHDHQEQSGPDKNPFLNVADLDGAGSGAHQFRRGYIVTRR